MKCEIMHHFGEGMKSRVRRKLQLQSLKEENNGNNFKKRNKIQRNKILTMKFRQQIQTKYSEEKNLNLLLQKQISEKKLKRTKSSRPEG